MKIKPYVRKAQYYETDQMGIIHHSNYIRWFEEARVDFMEQMDFGYRAMEDAGIWGMVLGVTCDYKRSVRFDDTFEVRCAVTKMDGVRMTVGYEVVDHNTGELRATGESRHCYANKKGRPVSLKKVLPDLYQLFLSTMDSEEEE